MTEPLTVHVDIEDWHQDTLRQEAFVSSQDDIVALLAAGEKSGVVARAAIVSREKGMAPNDVVRANKLLLHTGAVANIAEIARKKKEEVKTKSGRVYHIPGMVGSVRTSEEADAESDGDEPYEASYVPAVSDAARERAERYLLDRIPAQIWPRLLTVYKNGGDIEAVTDQLKEEINRQIREVLYKK